MTGSIRTRIERLEREAEYAPAAPRIDWDAVARGEPLVFPPSDPRRSENHPAVRMLRKERARLGLPAPGGYDGFDVIAEVLRLAAIPTPAGLPQPGEAG